MFKSFLKTTTAILVCLAPMAAHADDTENVIITATRLPTPESQIASSVTVIDAAEIEARQLRSLPDVLATVPGLNIVQVGGEGGQTSLFTRGTNSNHTKVLLDGIDISDPSTPSGAVDLGRVLAGDLARVEVLRGPSSGLYGSDAIGGVINLISKSGEGPLKLNASAEGGSFDTFNQTVSANGSSDNFHYQASVQHLHAGSTPVTPENLLLKGETRNNDFFDNITGATKLGLDLAPNFDLGLVGRYSGSLSRITGDAFNLTTFASYPSPTQTRITAAQFETRGTAHLNLGWIDQTLGLAYGSDSSHTLDPDNGPSRNSGDRIKLDWQGNVGLSEGETLVLGAETARDAIHLPLSAGVTTDAAFAELQTALDGSFFNSASIRYDDNSRYGDKVTWRVAPAYLLAGSGTKLKATIGSGFKAPSLQQLYLSYPAFGFLANPNLKPETSLGYDVGIEQALGSNASAGVTWFHNDIRNLISNNATFTTNINIGRARTQGLEAFAAWKPAETFSLRADYTYTEAVDAGTRLELLRRPKNKASLDGLWQARPDIDLDLTLLYVGPGIDGNRDFSIPRLKTSGYVTANLAGHYKLNDNFTVFARADNLLDKTYENPVGFQGPGRAFYAGIQASL